MHYSEGCPCRRCPVYETRPMPSLTRHAGQGQEGRGEEEPLPALQHARAATGHSPLVGTMLRLANKKCLLAGGLKPFLNNIIPVAKRLFCWVKPQLQRGFARSATSVRGGWRMRFAGPQGKGFWLVLREDYYAANIPTAIPGHDE